jgi:hypothetical protein
VYDRKYIYYLLISWFMVWCFVTVTHYHLDRARKLLPRQTFKLGSAYSPKLVYEERHSIGCILKTGTKLCTAIRLFTNSKKHTESERQKTVCFVQSVMWNTINGQRGRSMTFIVGYITDILCGLKLAVECSSWLFYIIINWNGSTENYVSLLTSSMEQSPSSEANWFCS